MNVGSLFSGIGGLDLGLARAGFRHAFFCESDPWRRDILARHWPGVPVYEDVREVAHSQRDGGRGSLERAGSDERAGGGLAERDTSAHVDLLCGGFPCQDLSVAGRRAGLAGERSGLFHEFARIAESLRPRWLLVENVPGLLSSNGGRDFGVVLATLADLGYGLAWRIVDSRYFGVPQRRRRVFVLGAHADGDPRAAAERAGEVLAVGTRCERHPATRGEAGEDVAVASLSGLGSGGPDDNDGQGGRLIADTVRSHPRPGSNSDGNLAYALRKDPGGTGQGHNTNYVAAPLSHGSNPNSNMAGRRREDDELVTGYTHSGGATYNESDTVGSITQQSASETSAMTPLLSLPAGVRRLTPTECERLQALPDGWTEPGRTHGAMQRWAMR